MYPLLQCTTYFPAFFRFISYCLIMFCWRVLEPLARARKTYFFQFLHQVLPGPTGPTILGPKRQKGQKARKQLTSGKRMVTATTHQGNTLRNHRTYRFPLTLSY
jgi:hypothetical protein